MRSRNDKEKALRRESMLDAAQSIFLKKGFEQTTMDDIASAADLSRGLLYVYFKDKQGMYDALKIRAIQTLGERMQRYSDQQTLGIDKVDACGRSFYDFYQYDRLLYDCLNHSMLTSNQQSAKFVEKRTEAVAEIEQSVMNIMLDAIETGWTDGSIRKDLSDDPLELALFMRGSLQGLVQLQGHAGSAMLHQADFSSDDFIINGIERMTSLLSTQR